MLIGILELDGAGKPHKLALYWQHGESRELQIKVPVKSSKEARQICTDRKAKPWFI